MELTVIVPTHERKGRLTKLLDSLASQTRKGFEVIVVDDASADGTPDAVKEYAKKFPLDITLLTQGKKGPAAARNLAIRESSAETVLFLNDDVTADPRLVEEHLRFHEKSPDTSTVGTILSSAESGWLVASGPEISASSIIAGGDGIPFFYYITANALTEKRHLMDAGLFDKSFEEPAGEDVDMGYRLHKAGVRLQMNDKAIVSHDHPLDAKAFASRQRLHGRGLARFVSKHPEFTNEYPVRIEPTVESALADASKALAEAYGLKISPGMLKAASFNPPAMRAIGAVVQRQLPEKRSEMKYALQRLCWAYHLSRGYYGEAGR